MVTDQAKTHDDFGAPRPYDFIIVTGDIYEEIVRSCEKHPQYPRDPLRRVAIMVEEAGEALKDAVDLTRPINVAGHPDYVAYVESELKQKRKDMRRELVQTAAMCVKALLAMRREDNR
jgi:hypothetical protein